MKKADIVFNILRVPVDFILLIAAGLFVYLLRTHILDSWRPVLFTLEMPFGRFFWLTIGAAILFVLAYAASGLYSMRLRITKGQELVRVLMASSGAIMLAILVIFLRQELFNSRFLVVGYWASATIFICLGRLVLRYIFSSFSMRTGWGAQRVLLIGDDDVAERIARTMETEPAMGYRIVGRLKDPDVDEVRQAISAAAVDEVLLADPDHAASKVVKLVDFCHDQHIAFTFVPNIHKTLTIHWDVDAIGRTPVVQLRRTSLVGWGRVFKRLADVISSSVALVILSPVFAVVAFAIKWETAGPVFVRLRRVSRGNEFDLLKFRSMIENAEELKPLLAGYNERADGPLFKMKSDPRVTRVGSWLRRLRLDELPQFWNVFNGDISLVGPRPHQPDEVARYQKHHRRVLAIKAGATGLAQVSGSSDLPFEEEVALDTFYIENWSFWLDLRVMLRTIGRILHDNSAV